MNVYSFSGSLSIAQPIFFPGQTFFCIHVHLSESHLGRHLHRGTSRHFKFFISKVELTIFLWILPSLANSQKMVPLSIHRMDISFFLTSHIQSITMSYPFTSLNISQSYPFLSCCTPTIQATTIITASKWSVGIQSGPLFFILYTAVGLIYLGYWPRLCYSCLKTFSDFPGLL